MFLAPLLALTLLAPAYPALAWQVTVAEHAADCAGYFWHQADQSTSQDTAEHFTALAADYLLAADILEPEQARRHRTRATDERLQLWISTALAQPQDPLGQIAQSCQNLGLQLRGATGIGFH